MSDSPSFSLFPSRTSTLTVNDEVCMDKKNEMNMDVSIQPLNDSNEYLLKTHVSIHNLLKQNSEVTLQENLKEKTITFLLNPYPSEVRRSSLHSFVEKLKKMQCNFEYTSPSLIEFSCNTYQFVVFFHDVASDSKGYTFDTIDVLIKSDGYSVPASFCRKKSDYKSGKEHIRAEMLPEELLGVLNCLKK